MDSGPASPGRKVVLAVEVLRTYPTARRLLTGDDVRVAVDAVRSDAAADGGVGIAVGHGEALRLGRAVARTLRFTPGLDDRCLIQSVVLLAMLARRGVAGVLVIGVKPGADFGAHAWVEVGGRPLLPTFGDEFTRLVEL